MQKILLKNRNITMVQDFDILISDIAEVMKRTIQAKKDYSEFGITLSASVQNTDELLCIIPYFN